MTKQLTPIVAYLDAILNRDEEYLAENRGTINNLLMELDPTNWPIGDTEPMVLNELMVLDALILNKNSFGDDIDAQLTKDYYFNHFGAAFFDVDPTAPLSIAGILNVSYCSWFHQKYNADASISLHGIFDFINELVDASPTSDETLNEYIMARLSEGSHLDQEFIYIDLNTHCFELSKLINLHGPKLINTVEICQSDDPVENMVLDLLDELNSTVAEIETFMDQSYFEVHAISILKASMLRLQATITDIVSVK